MSKLRFRVVETAFKKKAVEVATPAERPSEYFGKYTGKESIHYHRCRKRSIQKMGRDALSDAVSSQR